MGYSTLTAQLLTAPPYLLAFLSTILTTRASDRTLTRSPYIIAFSILASSGYSILSLPLAALPIKPSTLTTLKYLSLFPTVTGLFTTVALVIPWMLNNQRTVSGRGAGLVLMNVIGQCGPLVGTRLFPRESGKTGYRGGMAVCALAMITVAILAAGLRWRLKVLNNRRRGKSAGRRRRGKEAHQGRTPLRRRQVSHEGLPCRQSSR
jgi:hypothetical protein